VELEVLFGYLVVYYPLSRLNNSNVEWITIQITKSRAADRWEH